MEAIKEIQKEVRSRQILAMIVYALIQMTSLITPYLMGVIIDDYIPNQDIFHIIVGIAPICGDSDDDDSVANHISVFQICVSAEKGKRNRPARHEEPGVSEKELFRSAKLDGIAVVLQQGSHGISAVLCLGDESILREYLCGSRSLSGVAVDESADCAAATSLLSDSLSADPLYHEEY